MNQNLFTLFQDELSTDPTRTFTHLLEYSPLLATSKGFSAIAKELSTTLQRGLQKRYGQKAEDYAIMHLDAIVSSVTEEDPRHDLFAHLALHVAFSLFDAFPKRPLFLERLEIWTESLLEENPVDGVVLPFSQEKNPGKPG